MIVYAESSAVLAWLLGEATGESVRRVLGAAETVMTSDLTLVECDRAFHRARTLGALTAEEFTERSEDLERLSKGWALLRLSPEIVERARGPFPEGPVRSLDALHLASVAKVAEFEPGVVLLAHDKRLRRSAIAMGLRVSPDPVGTGPIG